MCKRLRLRGMKNCQVRNVPFVVTRTYLDAADAHVIDEIIIKEDDSSFHPRGLGQWINDLQRKIVADSIKVFVYSLAFACR